MRKAVVTFADGVGNYAKAMMRLDLSLKQVGFDGVYAGYNDYAHIGAPRHKGTPDAVPYAFKPYAIKKAFDAHRTRLILWADSVVYATKSIEPVFTQIQRDGYLFFDNIGFTVGDYTSDACLNKFGMSRDEAFKTQMIMACVMGLDMASKDGAEFFRRYFEAAKDGVSYHGDWTNDNLQVSNDMRVRGHRHDQSVASIIVKQMGLKITNAQESYFAYVEHKGRLKIADSVCLWSAGI